jgi:hypothetical protein
MVSSGFAIADPDDPGMLDAAGRSPLRRTAQAGTVVVGFDTAAPQLMADFAAGRL